MAAALSSLREKSADEELEIAKLKKASTELWKEAKAAQTELKKQRRADEAAARLRAEEEAIAAEREREAAVKKAAAVAAKKEEVRRRKEQERAAFEAKIQQRRIATPDD